MNIESEEEFRSYARTLPFDELLEVESTIDKLKYPERYRLVSELIDDSKEGAVRVYSKRYLENLKYPKGIRFIRDANILLLTLGIIYVPVKILSNRLNIGSPVFFEYLLSIVLAATIVYGLFLKRDWVVVIVLFTSYVQIAFLVLTHFAQHSDSTDAIIGSFMRIVFVLFYWYQVQVFSRVETKKFFKHKGRVLI